MKRLILELLFLPICFAAHSAHCAAQVLVSAPEGATSLQTSKDHPNERWDVLSLDGSSLVAHPPMLVGKDQLAGFTRELIRVQWRDDDPFYLWIITPSVHVPAVKSVNPAKAPKLPVVLYLLSFPSETDRFRDDTFCKLLVKNDFAAVGFVSALTGERYHTRSMKEWFVSELPESLAKSVHDVPMILDYLSSRGDIDINRAGMFGEGSGGAIAILAASIEPRLKAIDLLDPWGDWPDWLSGSKLVPDEERQNFLTPGFLKSVTFADPVLVLPKLGSVAVRYQYLAPAPEAVERARATLKAAMPRQAEILSQEESLASYKLSGGNDLFDWIKQRLAKPQRPPKASKQ